MEKTLCADLGGSRVKLAVVEDGRVAASEMFAVGAEISLSVCKAYKDIPGLPQGDYDRDAIFRELVKK